MKIIATLLMLAPLFGCSLSAQERLELKIGDSFPDHQFQGLLNYSKSRLNVQDYRGKLVILDLWATTCASCVSGWPKMLDLQKRFEGKLQIILLNKYEGIDVVKPYVERRRKLVNVDMTLPMICGDPAIKQLFPRNGVPRYVWIDSNGVVRSVTNSTSITASNIQKWISEGPFQLPQIIDDWERVNAAKPIFVDGNGGSGHSDKFIWNSVLTKCVENVPGIAVMFANSDKGYSITVTGASIASLYALAHDPANLKDVVNLSFLIPNRVDVRSNDTSKFYNSRKNFEFIPERSYDYQLISGKPVTRRQLLDMMKDDLGRFFGYSAELRRMKKMCLIWTMGDSSRVTYRGGIADIFLGDSEAIFDGVTVSESVHYIGNGSSYMFSPYPIVDETGFKGKLGLRLDCNCKDYNSLSREFRKLGMNLTLAEREVDVLVIEEENVN
jgi:thiol-disulfide isomerase/thioredoxin